MMGIFFLIQMLEAHGTMSFGDLLQPAIQFAYDGFPIHHRVSADWHDWAEGLTLDPTAAEYYLLNGKAPSIGATLCARF